MTLSERVMRGAGVILLSAPMALIGTRVLCPYGPGWDMAESNWTAGILALLFAVGLNFLMWRKAQ